MVLKDGKESTEDDDNKDYPKFVRIWKRPPRRESPKTSPAVHAKPAVVRETVALPDPDPDWGDFSQHVYNQLVNFLQNSEE